MGCHLSIGTLITGGIDIPARAHDRRLDEREPEAEHRVAAHGPQLGDRDQLDFKRLPEHIGDTTPVDEAGLSAARRRLLASRNRGSDLGGLFRCDFANRDATGALLRHATLAVRSSHLSPPWIHARDRLPEMLAPLRELVLLRPQQNGTLRLRSHYTYTLSLNRPRCRDTALSQCTTLDAPNVSQCIAQVGDAVVALVNLIAVLGVAPPCLDLLDHHRAASSIDQEQSVVRQFLDDLHVLLELASRVP